MKISDLLDVIEDDTVPIREKDIIASERIMEVTMAKINTIVSDNGTTRKKLGKGAIAAIVAAACLALSVTAFATGLVSRVVNWQGETIGEVEEVSMTPPPPGSTELDRFERTQSILDEAGIAELTLVKYTDENGATDTKSTGLTRNFSSVEELSAALSANDSELQVFDVPAGYAFHSAQVTYDCAAGYEYTLVSRETDDSGLTVETYSIPSEGIIISSYMIDYRDADGKTLFITGNLISTDVEFSVDENKTVETATINGMDSALIFEQTDVYGIVSASLEMSKTLSSPIPYVEKALLSGAHPTDDDVFKKIWYSVNAYGVDANALQEILAF